MSQRDLLSLSGAPLVEVCEQIELAAGDDADERPGLPSRMMQLTELALGHSVALISHGTLADCRQASAGVQALLERCGEQIRARWPAAHARLDGMQRVLAVAAEPDSAGAETIILAQRPARELLALVAGAPDGLTAEQARSALALSVSHAARLIAELVDGELLERDGHDVLRPGARAALGHVGERIARP